MAFLHNISTVARYEAKTLRRSWFFRLFSLGALIIFVFLNIGIFSPVGDEPWNLVAISSSVPLVNLYLLNIGQAVVVIFLAADFLKRDKKVDTNEVLYTRSMSNFEYILGKTWGILKLFLGLNLIILAIAFLINIISKTMTLDIGSYLSYLLIISVPTIIFSLGLAYVLMTIIRNQAITFLLLLGIAALDMFYLWFRAGSVFDYMVFGLPLFKSGIVGFDDLSLIINQRLLYLFLGLAFILTTVLLFNRLPQSRPHKIISFSFMTIFFVASGFCAYNTYNFYRAGVKEKALTIKVNGEFENMNFPALTNASIDLVHRSNTIQATASLKIKNDNNVPIDHYIFTLNPSLKVENITGHGHNITFRRANQVIDISPGKALDPGQTDSLVISYHGSINESFCYPNYSDNLKETPYRIAMVNVNKRQAFLGEKYLLLTPETYWYPSPSLNYYPSNPARIKVDFTKYSLRVKDEPGLTIVSQGKSHKTEGYHVFSPDSPLTGLTLAIGNYRTDTLKIDSVEYLSYYFPGHDYYKKDLHELKDTLKSMISGVMRDLETNFSVKFPFSTLSLVEVPVQFYSYPRECTQTRAEVQPSMVLLPEKLATLQNAGFYKQFQRQKRRNERNNQVITDKELQVRMFNNFIRNTFINGQNFTIINGRAYNEPVRYLLGPSFYFFRNNFYSNDYPVINSVFESHLQQVNAAPVGRFRGFFSDLSDNDRANLILNKVSFRDLLSRDPKGDTVRTVLAVKGDWLFNLLRSKAGIDEFNTWFISYLNKNSFKRIDITSFSNDVKEKFGFDFYPYLDSWFNGENQPGFLFSGLKASQIVVGDRSRYQVTFVASNPEPVAGLFNVSFRTGGFGRGERQVSFFVQRGGNRGNISISMQGRGMEAENISKIVLMEPGEAKKIGVVLDAQPREMMINTLFAKNIPGEITMPINNPVKAKGNVAEFTGEEILAKMPVFSDPSDIIVDNEDPGFSTSQHSTTSPLKRLLGIQTSRGKNYQSISMIFIPDYWQPVVQSDYYGKYVRSAVYTRAGSGDKSVTWNAIIKEPGYYDIFSYIGKTADRMMVRRGGRGGPGGQGEEERQPESPYKDLHYKIYHDEGIDDITLDYEKAEAGWNNLGRYYLSPDTARVVLTNQSSGRIVIGDAIKWVKEN
jgi:hypothetical protein